MKVSTPFVHVKTGCPVVLSTGIGDGKALWSVYVEKPNGSLKRCKQFGTHRSLHMAARELDEYSGKAFRRIDS